jgi:hypothetical protein
MRAMLAVFFLLTAWGAAAPVQQKDSPQQAPAQTQQTPANTAKGADAATEKPAAAPMTPAQARQAQLLADTERLYQLTQELKEEVAKSNKDTLSVPVIKKAEEVEKLARSLKERMRTPQ